MNVIDLFCGCGGLSEGFREAGFKVIAGLDNDEDALNTYQYNFKNAKVLKANLSDFNPKKINSLVDDKKIDVIVAGPPCQGFSLTGTRKESDPRNKLYLSVYRFVKELKPKAFLIENVPGLATLYDGEVRDNIMKLFDDIGYYVNSKILNSANYKVPQIRKRLFFVGVKKKYGKFEFPEKIIKDEENFVTCKEAIGDLPALSDTNYLGEEVSKYNGRPKSEYQKEMRQTQLILYNHLATNHTEHVRNVISLVPEGGNHRDLPSGVGESRKFNEAWTRYHSKKPSRTIDTGHRNHFHYKYNRVPTVRENARLQSFPDTFRFLGSKTSQNRQVGNAVPPKLAFYVASHIKNHLKKNGKNKRN